MPEQPGAEDVHRPTLGRRPAFWAVVYVLGVVMLGATLPTPLYVVYQRRFDFSAIVLTLIFAAYAAGTWAALVFFGRLSDQVGRRRVLLPALGLAAASTVVFLLASGVAWLFVARALSGLAVGLTTGTATAYLSELHPQGDKAHAARITSADTLLGLGLGPLLAGLLAEYAPAPTELAFLVYLGLLVPAAVLAWLAPETLTKGRQRISLRPRLGVPREALRSFLAPAAAVFVFFALQGLYSALAPSLLQEQLHNDNHAVAGAVVGALYGTAAVVEMVLHRVPSRTAMLAGLGLLIGSLPLVVLAFPLRSLVTFLASTAAGGMAVGLGYGGSLEVVNQIAPDERRGEVLSTYFLLAYAGLAFPTIGVGVLTELAGPLPATVAFAATTGVLAGLAGATGVLYPPRQRRQDTAR